MSIPFLYFFLYVADKGLEPLLISEMRSKRIVAPSYTNQPFIINKKP